MYNKFCPENLHQEDQQQNAPDRDAVEKSLLHVGGQADDKHRNPPTLEVWIGDSLCFFFFFPDFFGGETFFSNPSQKKTETGDLGDTVDGCDHKLRDGSLSWNPYDGFYRSQVVHDFFHQPGQFITTSAEVTPNGGLVRESPQKLP